MTRVDVDAELDRIRQARRYREASAGRPAKPNGGNAASATQVPTPESDAWRKNAFSAATLQTMTFPPLKFILPGFVPEGATLLVSRPKLGKSWLVLDLAIATAAGRFTLGHMKPIQGEVLYLALEDGPRRLQRRLTKLLPTLRERWSSQLTFATEWPRADQGGLAQIEAWTLSAEAPRLVIVDTFAHFRKVPTGKAQLYADDYAAISDLQKLASKYSVGIVIVHHDRKAEADDVFDTVSGTLGLSAAADTILVMKRQAGAVTLFVRGRDIEESETALQFNKTTCKWSALGVAAEVYRSAERTRVLEALQDGPKRAKELMLEAELRNRNATDILLHKMVRDGQIIRAASGQYASPDKEGKTGKKERPEAQPPQTTEEKTNLSDLSNLSLLPGSAAYDDCPEIPAPLRRAPAPGDAHDSGAGNHDDNCR
jgi:AAA domain